MPASSSTSLTLTPNDPSSLSPVTLSLTSSYIFQPTPAHFLLLLFAQPVSAPPLSLCLNSTFSGCPRPLGSKEVLFFPVPFCSSLSKYASYSEFCVQDLSFTVGCNSTKVGPHLAHILVSSYDMLSKYMMSEGVKPQDYLLVQRSHTSVTFR